MGLPTARTVLSEIDGTPAYSTVRTQLRVLQRKGHVRRKAVGAAYVYRPVMPRIHAQRTALLQLIDTFFGGSPADLVAMARSQSLGSPNGQRPGRHGRARQL